MPEPSAQLLARCSRGDRQAFAELVNQQQAFIYNLAYRLMGEAEEARDLAQEALLRVWQMLPSFRGEARFTTWLYRLVVNLGLNRLANLRRDRASPLPDEPPQPVPADLSADPQRLEDERERREFIWRQVDALPEKYRLVLTLYYLQERSYVEIAHILQLPINTVKTRIARARHMLASRLAGLGEDLNDL